MNIILKAWKDGLKPDPKINIVEWSDKYRYLSSKGASEHGKFNSKRVPYIIEIAEHLSPNSPVQEVYICKGVQMAITEMGNNMLFCYAHLYPRPMLGVLPTRPLLQRHLETKVWSGVEVTPILKKVILPIKQGSANSSSTLSMRFRGGLIDWGWSESRSTFASVTYGVGLASDIDRYPDDVEGEGDPISLFKKRLTTYGVSRKFLCESSPTRRKNSKIFNEVMNGDQNYYHMHCPHCDELIKFEKDNFIYSYDEKTFELTSDVEYACGECGSIIQEYQKFSMMAIENGAKWIPANPAYRNKLRKTYFLPSYYSPFTTWHEIFEEYLTAIKEFETLGKSSKLKTWYNTLDGSTYDDVAEKEVDTTIEKLLQRREEYTKIPNDVVCLSAGVDTQGDRFEVSVYGWINDREKYLIAHYIVAGDPKDLETQKQLDKLLFKKLFDCEDGGVMKIFCSAIDTGGNKTQHVYNYVLKRYKKYRIFAVKGGRSIDDPLIKEPSIVSTARNRTLKLYILGVNSAKDDWISDIEEQFNTRYLHFPHNIQKFWDGKMMEHDISDEAFLQQFLEETQDDSGRWENKLKRRNEALDCAIYAQSAVKCVKGLDLDKLAQIGKRAFYKKEK